MPIRSLFFGMAAFAATTFLGLQAVSAQPAPSAIDGIAAAEVKRLNALYQTNADVVVLAQGATQSTVDGHVHLGGAQIGELVSHFPLAEPAYLVRFIVGHEMVHQLQFRVYGASVLSRDAPERKLYECQADLLAAMHLEIEQAKNSDSANQLADDVDAITSIAADAGGGAYGDDHPDPVQRSLAVRIGLGQAVLDFTRSMIPSPQTARDPKTVRQFNINFVLSGKIMDMADPDPNLIPDQPNLPESLRVCREIVHADRFQVGALALINNKVKITWDTGASHSVVDYAIPYINKGRQPITVDLEIASATVSRANPEDKSKWRRRFVNRYQVTLQPDEIYVAKGELKWIATDDGMPKLIWPPNPLSLYAAHFGNSDEAPTAGAALAPPPTSLQFAPDVPDPAAVGDVLLKYALSPDNCFAHWRLGSAPSVIGFGSTTMGGDYISTLPVPGALDTEITTTFFCRVRATISNEAEASAARDAYNAYENVLEKALPCSIPEASTKNGEQNQVLSISMDYQAKLSLVPEDSGKFDVTLSIEKTHPLITGIGNPAFDAALRKALRDEWLKHMKCK